MNVVMVPIAIAATITTIATKMIYSKWTVGAMPPEAEAIRRKVFIEEQGFSEEEQFDGRDDRAWHLVVDEGGKNAATGRIIIDDEGNWKIGKIAVLPEFRGMHIGDFAVRLLVDRILTMPKAQIYVIAQQHAVNFYHRIGFEVEGEVFMIEGKPHQKMIFPEGRSLTGSCGGHCG